MTVKELIEKLNKFDGDLPVHIEGCDCIGDSVDVETYTTVIGGEKENILITRKQNV